MACDRQHDPSKLFVQCAFCELKKSLAEAEAEGGWGWSNPAYGEPEWFCPSCAHLPGAERIHL